MLELKNISAGYGGKSVINDISLSLPEGKLITVAGPNGSGKSTFIKAVVGIIPVLSGEITLDGQRMLHMSRRERAKTVSYLPQGKSVPDMTVKQMVLHGRFPYLNYPRRYSRKDMEITEKALEKIGISDFSQRSMASLSGGMRQKAYIAMALAQDTDYIFLDEPTTYLDISAQLELMRILRSLTDTGKCVVTVMHDLPLAFRFSDEIVILNGGKVCGIGSPDEICEKNICRRIFGVDIQRKNGKDFYCEYSEV